MARHPLWFPASAGKRVGANMGDKSMDFLNNIVGQLGGTDKIASLARQVGLSEEQVQSAMAALGKAAPQPGDTAASAAQSTGLPLDKLQDLLAQVGGEDALKKVTGFLDRDGDGNPVNDIMGFAKKFTGQ
jgi:DNA-binding phage protein